MTIYIALLRGINVGGHNMVKMAELRSMFQSIGLNRVQTYIQSGNVLFDSADDSNSLRQRIEQEIERVFSLSLTVILRTSVELERIITNCPFSEAVRREAESTEVETFYVSLLLEPPALEYIEQLRGFASIDEFRIQDREVYLLLREGVRNSKLANNLFRLNVPSTMRNWKTMNKLNTLAKAIET
ncbi:DUF1697 domain-containing protein [Alicyclobacillus tolerans]|uniref:DUF1697 domain-containing protein n=1 Tax=Alicyclobacillus tolerans TaxID=90970 RepID=UPI001F44B112|nr:DUF1697 domain-containing protein [Alicyclobacillus tolerans]MCF8564192.1 DUF1697 domain-containing protein [Alicyclobacillus tolerans]